MFNLSGRRWFDIYFIFCVAITIFLSKEYGVVTGVGFLIVSTIIGAGGMSVLIGLSRREYPIATDDDGEEYYE